MVDLAETRRLARFLDMFERPCEFVRHEDAVAAGGKRRHDVRFQRVADHHRPFRPIPDLGEDAAVGGGVLVRNDLDRIEKVAEPGLGKLALLIEEIALGNQHQQVFARQGLQRLAHVGQGFDGMGEKIAADIENLRDDV